MIGPPIGTFTKLILLFLVTMLFCQTTTAQDTVKAEQIFQQRCSSCHTIGDGTRIGPDLKGVNERRDEEWLIQFIRNSQKMINEGDQTAVKLFNEFNQTVMPANKDYSDKKIKAILSYIEKGGSETSTAQTTGGDTLRFAPDRSKGVGGSNLRAVTPDDFIFQMAFWFSLVLIVGIVMGLGYVISRLS